MKFIKLAVPGILLLVLTGCASAPIPTATETPPQEASQPDAAPAATASPIVAIDPLNDPKGRLSKRSVYFPYKIDAIQPTYAPLLKAHGNYLGKHPEHQVRVEGNCDERGSNEYNLALGQRRADNTRRSLVDNGASESQITAISYGEDRPRSRERTEAGWAENRRADLNYNP